MLLTYVARIFNDKKTKTINMILNLKLREMSHN